MAASQRLSAKPRVVLLGPVSGLAHGKWLLSGHAYGHPAIPNGEWITTSEVIRAMGSVAETHNTVYILASHVQVPRLEL